MGVALYVIGLAGALLLLVLLAVLVWTLVPLVLRGRRAVRIVEREMDAAMTAMRRKGAAVAS